MNTETTVANSRHIDQQSANLAYFLKWARTKNVNIVGTVPNGALGGTNASNVAFTSEIPVIPMWATAMVLEITLPISLVVPAGATARISPYFPYSSMLMQLLLAGSPPWDQISLVPWWLDEITSQRFFDPTMIGPTSAPSAQEDPGPFVYSHAGFTPGGTIVNGGGSAATTTGTVTFRVRVRLQRKPKLLFGAIPLGDPENRPQLKMQLAALVGPNPEANPFQDTAGAGITASLSGVGTVNVEFEGRSLDVLPPGLDQIPTPIVGMGVAVNYGTKGPLLAGALSEVPLSAAMLYQKNFHLLVNNQQGQRADYFGKWLTGEQQSARWEYDAAQGTFNQYYEKMQKRYNRFFPVGCYIDDMVSGDNADDPAGSPYEAEMTPDTGYAAEFGIAATPAWQNALRIPVGTALTAPYVATYNFGLVNVPY
jgi:hypothetical protein